MRIALFTCLLIIFCSCGRRGTDEKDNTGSVIKIDLLSEPRSGITRLSDFASDIGYIPLQTTENSLMGNVRHKIVNPDNRIYLENTEGIFNSVILCFDTGGKFLFKLQKAGRGPEEYTSIADFDVSSDNKVLTILSGLDHKLQVYGISDTGFTFRRSVTLKGPVPERVSMVPETDKAFLAIPPWRGTEPTLSLLINTYGDTILFKPNCYNYKMVRKENFVAGNEMIVYSFGNKVCFKEEFSDTVFCIDSKSTSFKPRMIFDSHGTLATPEVRGGSQAFGNQSTYIANIFETLRYVFGYYISSGPIRNRFIFDKITRTKYLLDTDNKGTSKVKDDLAGGPDFNIEFLDNYCSNNRLFSFVEAIALKKFVAGEDFRKAKVGDPKKKEELKRLAESLKETDNPVLVVVTPKE